MPHLKKIVIQDFRNIEFQELQFSPNVNCICGNNGEGKTNLLDAIHYLSMTRSAFATSDKFIFRHGQKSFSLCGTYSIQDHPEVKFAVQATSNGDKKLKKDDKVIEKISSHIGTLPIVMVSPTDISLVSESGEERRRLMNAVLSQMDREYLSAAQQYNRLLGQRNTLLKDGKADPALLSVIDAMLSDFAQKIWQERTNFAQSILPIVKEYYSLISGGKEEIGIEYKSDLNEGNLENILQQNLKKDAILGFTSAGVHRDDLVFTLNGHTIRRFGSQGQQKSFLVSLKFALYETMKLKYGFAPILLLDDVFDKLDIERISNLISMVSGKDFGQIFITDCSQDRIKTIVDAFTEDRAYFEAENGTFKML